MIACATVAPAIALAIERGAVRKCLLSVCLLAVAPAVAAQERLTLDEAVRPPTVRNPTALVAEQEIRRAEGILKEVRAPSLPVLTANAVATELLPSTCTEHIVPPSMKRLRSIPMADS